MTSTLNNLALAYSVSIPVYIIFRSGGTFVTMIMGWLVVGKRYTSRQIVAVAVLTAGVVLATWSNAHNQVSPLLYMCVDKKRADAEQFNIGIIILFAAQVLSSFMGIYLESTYARYGSNWREGLFYTVFRSSPILAHLLALPRPTILHSPPPSNIPKRSHPRTIPSLANPTLNLLSHTHPPNYPSTHILSDHQRSNPVPLRPRRKPSQRNLNSPNHNHHPQHPQIHLPGP